MHRPKYVGEAISLTKGGIQVGRYLDFELRPAFQSIFALNNSSELVSVAFEGLVRGYSGNRPASPAEIFGAVYDEDRLFLDAMCQALHIRNYHLATPAGNMLFLNVDPRIYGTFEQLEWELGYTFDRLPEHGLSTSQIVIELLENESNTVGMLQRMRDFCSHHNVLFAMDDYGKASSNFERYQILQPDIVKLDGKLLARLCRDARTVKVFRTAVNQFHDHGVKVLAEGIESPKQLDIALQVDVNFFQGFFLDHPHELPHTFQKIIPIDQFRKAG